jgi:hypothetical protein
LALGTEAPIHDRVEQFIVDNDEHGTNLIFRDFHNTGQFAKNSVFDPVVETPRATARCLETSAR